MSILISDKVHFRTKKVLGIKILHDDKSINSSRRQKLRAFIYKTTKPQNIEGKTQECRKKKQPRVSDGDQFSQRLIEQLDRTARK